MKLKDGVYDILKWLVIIVLPAAAVFYGRLAGAWGWPYSEAITETIVAVQMFLGAIIGVSTASYYADQAKAQDYVAEEGELPVIIQDAEE